MDSDARKILLPWSMPRLAPSQCHCRVALYDAILRETNTNKLHNSNQHGIVHYLLYLPRGANVILLIFFWSFQHVITNLGSLGRVNASVASDVNKSIRRTAPEEHPTVHVAHVFEQSTNGANTCYHYVIYNGCTFESGLTCIEL